MFSERDMIQMPFGKDKFFIYKEQVVLVTYQRLVFSVKFLIKYPQNLLHLCLSCFRFHEAREEGSYK